MKPELLSFEPVRAFTALSALVRDPEDTSRVFAVIDAFSGNNGQRVLKRLRRTQSGAQILDVRPEILPLLQNLDWLRSQSSDSLAAAYLHFMHTMGITAGGLIEAATEQRDAATADLEWLRCRLRDTHDLWHTVLGYHGDLLGEASVLAFSAAQIQNPGIGLIVLAAMHRANAEQRQVITTGFKRGLIAAWFPAVRWELLLPLPLAEVRRQLRVDDPPRYERIMPSEIQETGWLH